MRGFGRSPDEEKEFQRALAKDIYTFYGALLLIFAGWGAVAQLLYWWDAERGPKVFYVIGTIVIGYNVRALWKALR